MLFCPLSKLKTAAEKLYAQYRASKNSFALFSDSTARLAYLGMRMPATYAAISCALDECRQRFIGWTPRSLVDIGAGPGTGGWAAAEQFLSLESIHFVEPSKEMASLGQRLASHSPIAALRQAQWSLPPHIPSSDLALLSYLVAELSLGQRNDLLEELWKKIQGVIVIVEPGTPDGYQRIIEIRQWALDRGAQLVAPCPHQRPCPMQRPQWCHFPARVERTKLHKLLKNASLGYEDEKFSYIAFGKIPVRPPTGRIVGNPIKQKGFVQISLCIEGRCEERIVSRKQEGYRSARDAKYGEAWM